MGSVERRQSRFWMTATKWCCTPARLVYLSSGLHRGGEGSLDDLDWTTRAWDPARAYAESKLHVAALAFAVARRWPQVLSNAVDPGWARTKMGGAGVPVDLDTEQRIQTWLAVCDEPAALAREATDPEFQDRLISELGELTGVALPQA
jgi:NAD(P)-dependent dehydrogenase (short-subunit alcohol dehydrogenase family)